LGRKESGKNNNSNQDNEDVDGNDNDDDEDNENGGHNNNETEQEMNDISNVKTPMESHKRGRNKVAGSTAAVQDNLVTPIGGMDAAPSFLGSRHHEHMVKQALKKTKERIKTYVKTELFHKVKFIREEIELDFKNKFYAGAIMTHMGVAKGDREQWWSEYKVVARQALSEKRATVCSSIKSIYKGRKDGPCKSQCCANLLILKFAADLVERNELPTLSTILQMRHGTGSAYQIFCDEVLSQVVGKLEWKTGRHSRKISRWATTSDEAFALILLENSWDLWAEMAEQAKLHGKKTAFVATKEALYSRSGAGTKKYGGWTSIGLKRFGEIANLVQADRMKIDGRKFEEDYQEKWRSESSVKRRVKKSTKSTDPNDDFEIYMDGTDSDGTDSDSIGSSEEI
jgi:hypothetical protein